MKEQLITFDTAKLAKEKGFDLKEYRLDNNIALQYYEDTGNLFFTFSKVSGYYLAPTQSLLQKWLRDVHKIDITIIINYSHGDSIKTYRCGIIYINNNLIESFFSRPINELFKFIEYSTYEDALEIGLQEGLKLIKI